MPKPHVRFIHKQPLDIAGYARALMALALRMVEIEQQRAKTSSKTARGSQEARDA